MTGRIPFSKFGRDHWALLAQVDRARADAAAASPLDPRRLRRKPQRRTLFSSTFPDHPGPYRWGRRAGTRLRGFVSREQTPECYLHEHDDFDCLDDLWEVKLILPDRNCMMTWCLIWQLTKLGDAVAAALRRHVRAGGSFSTFVPPAERLTGKDATCRTTLDLSKTA